MEHFATVSGYGHDDLGRDTLDRVYAQVFNCEAAMVRNHFVSGTHAIACALFGNLNMVTNLFQLQETLRHNGRSYRCERQHKCSLKGQGVLYEEVPLIKRC